MIDSPGRGPARAFVRSVPESFTKFFRGIKRTNRERERGSTKFPWRHPWAVYGEHIYIRMSRKSPFYQHLGGFSHIFTTILYDMILPYIYIYTPIYGWYGPLYFVLLYQGRGKKKRFRIYREDLLKCPLLTTHDWSSIFWEILFFPYQLYQFISQNFCNMPFQV